MRPVTFVSRHCLLYLWAFEGWFVSFFILLLQALFFAHGGLTTLGVNTLTLIGPLVTVCLWYLLQKIRLNSSIALGFVCGMGGLSVYIVDALVLGSALSNASGIAMIEVSLLYRFPCLYLRGLSQ